MKLTRHNGRSGKHGTYNPRHNDRRFDVENSEHIDAERARQNVYWDCYRGFTTHEFRENPEQPDFSFEEIERMYYYEHYGGHVEAQNARNEKTRHTERNRTVEDLLKTTRPARRKASTRSARWENPSRRIRSFPSSMSFIRNLSAASVPISTS